MREPRWMQGVNSTLRKAVEERGRLVPTAAVSFRSVSASLEAPDAIEGTLREKTAEGTFVFQLHVFAPDRAKDCPSAVLGAFFADNFPKPKSGRLFLPIRDTAKLYNVLTLPRGMASFILQPSPVRGGRIEIVAIKSEFLLSTLNGELLSRMLFNIKAASIGVWRYLVEGQGQDMWTVESAL